MAKKIATSLSKKELKTAKLGKPVFVKSAEFKPSPGLKKAVKQRAEDEKHLLGQSKSLLAGAKEAIKLDKKRLVPSLPTHDPRKLVAAVAPEPPKKEPSAPRAVPVESHLPGIPRVPKVKKIPAPLAADGSLVPLEIISYHFLKLMERLAAEQGGTSAKALEDLKADIAKGKTP